MCRVCYTSFLVGLMIAARPELPFLGGQPLKLVCPASRMLRVAACCAHDTKRSHHVRQAAAIPRAYFWHLKPSASKRPARSVCAPAAWFDERTLNELTSLLLSCDGGLRVHNPHLERTQIAEMLCVPNWVPARTILLAPLVIGLHALVIRIRPQRQPIWKAQTCHS